MFTALIALATAASVPSSQISVGELLTVAEQTCPLNPSVLVLDKAAKVAKLTKRDTETMFALCSIYHLGRADEVRASIIRDYGVDPGPNR